MALEAVHVTETRLADRIPSHVFRFVEQELYDYPVNRELVLDYLRRRNEILHKGRQMPELDVVPDGGELEDPTFHAALRLLAIERSAQRAMEYVAAIDSVMRTLTDEQRKFVKRKYWDKDCTDEALAMELGMSRATLYRMQKTVIRAFALRFGLL